MSRHIVIDNRISGSSTGRYSDKLVEYLHKQKTDYQITVITSPERESFIKKIAPTFRVVTSTSKIFSLNEQLGFLWLLVKLKPDLVFFSMVQQPLLFFGKSVTTMHDLTALNYANTTTNFFIQTIKQFLYNFMNFVVAKKSSKILTPSNYVKKQVSNKYKIKSEKIVVTYESADQITLIPKITSELKGKDYLLYVGRAQQHKNLQKLIIAFVALQKKYPKLYLVLAGKQDPAYRQIIQFVKENDYQQIVFLGFVNDSQLLWLYSNAQAYIFPSLSEGFGLPGLEAMAHGCPVASSNATCLPEIYGNAAHYFNPNSTTDMINKIGEVLGNKQLRQELVANGYQQTKKYSWEKMTKKTLDIFNQVL